MTFPRRCFFCGSFMLFLSCICYAFVRVCLLMPCGHLLWKCWPLGSRLWCLIVKLSLFHWYPGSGVVLDCIDSCSLPSFLLYFFSFFSLFSLFSLYLAVRKEGVEVVRALETLKERIGHSKHLAMLPEPWSGSLYDFKIFQNKVWFRGVHFSAMVPLTAKQQWR